MWHLDCCNPENNLDGKGWLIFGAIFGWTNSATRESCIFTTLSFLLLLLLQTPIVGSVLSYVFYWIAAIVALVILKWREGRIKILGLESSAGRARRLRQEADRSTEDEKGLSAEISELPR